LTGRLCVLGRTRGYGVNSKIEVKEGGKLHIPNALEQVGTRGRRIFHLEHDLMVFVPSCIQGHLGEPTILMPSPALAVCPKFN
jgi:hypothetical protein